jgi:hypothetical protein
MNSAHKEVRNLTNLVKTTRRRLLSGAAALTVLIALAALGSPATAFAQDSTPIVFLGTETYSAGGGYVEADQLSFTPGYLATAGHGGWKSTGKDAFLLTYMNLTYDANGNPTGSGKVRQTTTMSGNSYSGSGDYHYYDVNGKVVASGTFTITAKRILVQAPKQ